MSTLIAVTEREVRLAALLQSRLHDHSLTIGSVSGPITQAAFLVAYQIAAELVHEVRAEELLEQLAEEHEIECELLEADGVWLIVPYTSWGEAGAEHGEPLAAGDTPAAAVEELRRDLETPSLAEYSDEQLLAELLDRAKGRR